MKKLRYTVYESPSFEWLVSPEEEFVLCQSPYSNSDLGDIDVGSEEGEDQGWLN